MGAPWASPAPDRVAPGTQHRRPAERQGTKSSCPATWRGGQGAAGLQAGLWERTWTRLGHTLDIAKETQEIWKPSFEDVGEKGGPSFKACWGLQGGL